MQKEDKEAAKAKEKADKEAAKQKQVRGKMRKGLGVWWTVTQLMCLCVNAPSLKFYIPVLSCFEIAR